MSSRNRSRGTDQITGFLTGDGGFPGEQFPGSPIPPQQRSQGGKGQRSLTAYIQALIATELGKIGLVTNPRNRFPSIPYDELPNLPLGKGDVSQVLHTLDEMHTREAPVEAIALAHILASLRSDHTGYAMTKRFDFLLGIGPLAAAIYSAQQYQQTAPQMDSRKAEATSQLIGAELMVLHWLQGGEIRWNQVINTAQFSASEFRQLPGCTKREGSCYTLLALAYLVQWQQFRRQTPRDRRDSDPKLEVAFSKLTTHLHQAVVLVGTGYGTDVVDMVRSVNPAIVDETLEGSGSQQGRHTSRASSRVGSPA